VRRESIDWAIRGVGLAVGVGFVLVISGLLWAARDVVLLVFLAVLLGAALEPLVATIRGRIRVGRGPAILVVYAVFLAAVLGIAVFIVPAALVQLSAALAKLPAFLEQVRAWGANLRPGALGDGISSLIDAIEGPLKQSAPPDPNSVVNASLLVGEAGGALITLLFMVYFWLTERPRLQRYALAFVPAGRRGGIRDAWNQVEARLGLWARGQLVLMATIGIATGIAYSLLGLPAALLLGLIAAIMEIIPIVGPLLGAIPALLVATTVSPETVLLTLGIYFVLQLIEGNVLVPLIMRNSVGLSPFLVLTSLLVGGTVGGPLGAIVAVPLVAGVTVVLERLQDREVPVPIDPAGPETPDAEAIAALEAPPASQPPKRSRRRALEAPSTAQPPKRSRRAPSTEAT
jgi:predicted PurR-regulated permease PerM